MTTQATAPPVAEKPETRVAAAPARVAVAAPRHEVAWLVAGVGLASGLVGLFATVGADARWLAALGRYIAQRGAIPHGVPFASASTSHWVNSLVLAELVFHGLESGLGDRGLILANLVAVIGGLSLLALDARREGAGPSVIAGTLLLVAIAVFPSLAIARVQMFSIILFPALLWLLRADARQPSARIWWALPLLALWSNLHGAALAGVGVLWAYLLLSRGRRQPVSSALLAAAALVALCVTPAGLSTVTYYHGLLTNVAAQRGVGQWAPLGQSPFDWATVVIALILGIRLRRRLPEVWEAAVIVGLAVLTIKAARDGVWLMFFLVAPATRGRDSSGRWNALAPVLVVLGVLLLAFDVARAPHPSGASSAMVKRAVQLAGGTPILADGLPSEQIAWAGGRIWAGNPLDAFSRRVQSEYVDFLTGSRGGRVALNAAGVRYVLVTRGSSAAALTAQDRHYTLLASDATALLYRRGS